MRHDGSYPLSEAKERSPAHANNRRRENDMKTSSLNRAAAVALAMSAAGCGTGISMADDRTHAQLLAASAALQAEGTIDSATDSAAQGNAASVESQRGMIAQRHFDLYQRFHGLSREESAVQALGADKQHQIIDDSTAAVCQPTADTKPVSSGE
jgi:hypothetical protein